MRALNEVNCARPKNGLQTEIKKREGGQNAGFDGAKEKRFQNRSARA